MRLFDYVKKIKQIFTKDELKQSVRLLVQSLQKGTEAYSSASDTLTKFNSKAGKDFESAFLKAVRPPARTTMVSHIHSVLTNISMAVENISGLIDKSYGQDLVVDGITYKRAEILRTLGYMDFVCSYSVKLLHYLVVAEAAVQTKEHAEGRERPKPELQWLQDHRVGYLELVKAFGVPYKEIVKLLESIPDVSIGPDDEKLLMPQIGAMKLDPLKNNAIPGITSAAMVVGMWIVKLQLVRYDYLKDTVRSIQLRLEQLRLQQSETNDAQLQRTIEKYEQYLDKAAESLAKMEEKYL